jgi:hypothetical protein
MGLMQAWFPCSYDNIVRLAVSRAPPHLRARLAEEWGAHLNDTPANLSKFLLAVDLFRASAQLRRDAEAAAEQSAAAEGGDTALLDGARQAIVAPVLPVARVVETVGAFGHPLLRTEQDVLGYQLREEQAATINRLARELRDALDALGDFDGQVRRANAAVVTPVLGRLRARLVDTAAYALWHFVVQRDCMGFRLTEDALADYAVPAEVRAKMGVFRPRR